MLKLVVFHFMVMLSESNSIKDLNFSFSSFLWHHIVQLTNSAHFVWALRALCGCSCFVTVFPGISQACTWHVVHGFVEVLC